MLVTDLIAQDHRSFQRLFFELEEARPPAPERLERLVEELNVHAEAEEAVFYPAVREVSRRIDDAEGGHEHMRALIEATRAAQAGSRDFAEALLQLKQTVLNHAMEEEAGVFMDAARLGLEKLEALGAKLEEQKRTLRASARRAA
jgi:hemerythrin superfamily protein